jgi:hypothetical protein
MGKQTHVSNNESSCGPAGQHHPILRVLFSPPTVGGCNAEAATPYPALSSSKRCTAESSEQKTFGGASFVFVNGHTGKDNPQRQGLDSATSDGASLINVLGGIPTVATDYSPIGISIQRYGRGYRSRMMGEFAILGMLQKGWITGLDGKKFGSVGVVVNCSIVYRFL